MLSSFSLSVSHTHTIVIINHKWMKNKNKKRVYYNVGSVLAVTSDGLMSLLLLWCVSFRSVEWIELNRFFLYYHWCIERSKLEILFKSLHILIEHTSYRWLHNWFIMKHGSGYHSSFTRYASYLQTRWFSILKLMVWSHRDIF